MPLIEEALGPGVPAEVGGLRAGFDLQRHDLDLTRFPNALSNDGTGALFYFRPYEGEANRDRWVIQLKGGGACRRADECARRWLSVGTNFGATQMSSERAPSPGTVGDGILYRGDEFQNPVAGWNQVFLWYSSSDGWSGSARDQIVNTTHPLTGEPVSFRIHFLGSRILDAVLDTLRRQGVQPLVYTLNGSSLEMPDLDEAAEVVLAGASAGGTGVANNLDLLTDTLRRHNTRCSPADCPLMIWGLIDSSFSPAYETLDFSTTALCPDLAPGEECTWQGFMEDEIANGSVALWRPRGDTSCLPWHRTHIRGTEWQCADGTHVIRHHVTTPFFMRMGQQDELHSGNLVDAAFSVPDDGLLTLESFAELVREQLLALAEIFETAHEGAAIQTVPGAFGPTCPKHETLSNNEHVFNAQIAVDGDGYSMFDVIRSWLYDIEPSIVVTEPGGLEFCPL